MSTIVLKYTETDSKFLEECASKIELEGNEWFYMPFWFKKVGDGKFAIYNFSQLPENIKNHLQQLRDGI